jgi:periplasmic divalent cation tolerance protein
MSNLLQLVTTVDESDKADQIAATLINERLAACVQIDGPITSVYRWEGQVHRDQEWRCTIKTIAERSDEVLRRLEEIHPYDTPEILAIRVDQASEGYAKWARENVD